MDDIQLYAGSGGDLLAADEISGVKYQRVKLIHGANGTNSGDVSVLNRFPVDSGLAVDAFQRTMTADPDTLFESQFQYDLQPLLWEEITATGGSVAHQPNSCAARLTTGTGSGSLAALQTRQYFRYQPGKAQQIFMTFVMGAASANVRRRAGYFDGWGATVPPGTLLDGIYLEQNGLSDVALVCRTSQSGSVVETSSNRIAQASWSYDTFGAGALNPSGLTLDLSKAQILVVDLQVLGVGRVRIGFDIDGVICWAHEFRNANNLASVYMRTANLPCRYEQTTTGAASSVSMDAICAAVVSSGGYDEAHAYTFAVGNTADVGLTTTRARVLAIRPRTTFNSIVNRCQMILDSLEVLGGNAPVYWELLYNATHTGGTWNSVDATNSAMEYSVDTTASGGIVVASGFIPSSGGTTRSGIGKTNLGRWPMVLDASGANPRALTLAARSTTGTPNVRAAMTWKEWR